MPEQQRQDYFRAGKKCYPCRYRREPGDGAQAPARDSLARRAPQPSHSSRYPRFSCSTLWFRRGMERSKLEGSRLTIPQDDSGESAILFA